MPETSPPPETSPRKTTTPSADTASEPAPETPGEAQTQTEIGGPSGPEPTRFGDWERKGRCIDF